MLDILNDDTVVFSLVPSDVPLNLEAFAVNATHAHLSWSPPLPEHRNGLIEIYHIASQRQILMKSYNTYLCTIVHSLDHFIHIIHTSSQLLL